MRAQRRLETVAVPGRSLPVTLELKNCDPWPKRHLLVQDRLPQWLERDGDARPILTPLAASGTETIKGKFVIDLGSGGALILHSPFVGSHKLLDSGIKTIKSISGGGAGPVRAWLPCGVPRPGPAYR